MPVGIRSCLTLTHTAPNPLEPQEFKHSPAFDAFCDHLHASPDWNQHWLVPISEVETAFKAARAISADGGYEGDPALTLALTRLILERQPNQTPLR